jgi:hypothetical protein
MNAMTARRATFQIADRLRVYNAELERERALAMAEAVLAPMDEGADGPAAASRQKITVDVEGHSRGSASKGGRVTAKRVVCECQMDTYHAQGHITAQEWTDGIWFRRRYLLGYKAASTTAGYGERGAAGSADAVSVRVLNARHDLAQIAGLLGMLEWATLETVAGGDTPAGAGRLKHLRAALEKVKLYRDVSRAESAQSTQ